jgi:hypothetical protein
MDVIVAEYDSLGFPWAWGAGSETGSISSRAGHASEFILAYVGRPSYSMGIMEFPDGKAARIERTE